MMSWPSQMGAGVPSQGPDWQAASLVGRDCPVATVVPAVGDASHLGWAQAPVGTHTYVGPPPVYTQAPQAGQPVLLTWGSRWCLDASGRFVPICPGQHAVANILPGARAHLNSTDDPRKELEMLSSQVKVRVMSEL